MFLLVTLGCSMSFPTCVLFLLIGERESQREKGEGNMCTRHTCTVLCMALSIGTHWFYFAKLIDVAVG